MIEIYDVYEKQTVMINVNKIIIVYRDKAGKVNIKVDGLEYPIETDASYEEIKGEIAKKG